MSKFLREEKPKQVAFKENSAYFSEAAKAEGSYRNHSYPTLCAYFQVPLVEALLQ